MAQRERRVSSGTPVVLDTNIASQRFKKRSRADLTRLIGTTSVISFVTNGELHKWARMRDWAPNSFAALQEWLAHTPIIESDHDIAVTWGDLSAAGAKRGQSRPQNDTWIAACCLVYDMPLATYNVRDFQDFADDHGLRLFDLGPTS